MVFLIISDNKSFRKKRLGEILEPLTESEIILFDDAVGELADLEQYLYPSLFSEVAPIIHAQFVLDETVSSEGLKKLIASPTIFILEELTLPSTTVTLFKKCGAIIHATEKQKIKKQDSDIFSATACITATDKKSRWLAYRSAIEKHSIEAILGILYWKVRTLATKGQSGNEYEVLYVRLLDAQSRAWQTGAPLEALIEKVILTS